MFANSSCQAIPYPNYYTPGLYKSLCILPFVYLVDKIKNFVSRGGGGWGGVEEWDLNNIKKSPGHAANEFVNGISQLF